MASPASVRQNLQPGGHTTKQGKGWNLLYRAAPAIDQAFPDELSHGAPGSVVASILRLDTHTHTAGVALAGLRPPTALTMVKEVSL